LYYLGNAALLGSLAVLAIMAIKGHKDIFLNKIALISGVFAVLSVAIYSVYLMMSGEAFTSVGYYFDPTMPTKAMIDPSTTFGGLLSGDTALLYWLGVVVAGLVIPFIALVLVRKKEPKQTAIISVSGLVFALGGGMCFRVILYLLGSSVFLFY
jgi:formate-dependent nitrite reductase membrane component NrfD